MLQVVAKAKVPIIKFIEIKSNINFDISFDVANGPVAAGFVRDLMETLPPMKSLVLVLKIFLQQREFNEVGSPYNMQYLQSLSCLHQTCESVLPHTSTTQTVLQSAGPRMNSNLCVHHNTCLNALLRRCPGLSLSQHMQK